MFHETPASTTTPEALEQRRPRGVPIHAPPNAAHLLEEGIVPREGAQQNQGRLFLRSVPAEPERPL